MRRSYAFQLFKDIRVTITCNLNLLKGCVQTVISAENVSRPQIPVNNPDFLEHFQKLTALFGKCSQIILTGSKHFIKLLMSYTAYLLSFECLLFYLKQEFGKWFSAELIREPYVFRVINLLMKSHNVVKALHLSQFLVQTWVKVEDSVMVKNFFVEGHLVFGKWLLVGGDLSKGYFLASEPVGCQPDYRVGTYVHDGQLIETVGTAVSESFPLLRGHQLFELNI